MMLKLLPLTALALGLSSGSALADRDHGRNDHRGGAVVRDHRGDSHRGDSHRGDSHRGDSHRGDWRRGDSHRGGNVVIRDRGNWRNGSRVVVRNEPRYYNRHVVRRPIYVSRPVIRHRYFNYYQRPAIIFENYSAMPGYYWVRGAWTWDGYEWIWQPGHYEPDPNYVDSSYGYYDGY